MPGWDFSTMIVSLRPLIYGRSIEEPFFVTRLKSGCSKTLMIADRRLFSHNGATSGVALFCTIVLPRQNEQQPHPNADRAICDVESRKARLLPIAAIDVKIKKIDDVFHSNTVD